MGISELFQAFRNEYGYTDHGELRTSVTYDSRLFSVVYVCALMFVASLIWVVGIRGKSNRIAFISVVYQITIATSILVSIWSNHWMSGEITVRTHYLYKSSSKMTARVGLWVGLTNANISLVGIDQGSSDVSYNERLRWFEIDQLRADYKDKIIKGLPHPVLLVSAVISNVDDGPMWGRRFHIGGYFSYVLLWTAFSFWICATLVIKVVLFQGAFMMTLTGASMLLANLVFFLSLGDIDLWVPFDNTILKLEYDWSFWLIFAAGTMTFVTGVGLLILDLAAHKSVARKLRIHTELKTGNGTCALQYNNSHSNIKENLYRCSVSHTPDDSVHVTFEDDNHDTSEMKMKERRRWDDSDPILATTKKYSKAANDNPVYISEDNKTFTFFMY